MKENSSQKVLDNEYHQLLHKSTHRGSTCPAVCLGKGWWGAPLVREVGAGIASQGLTEALYRACRNAAYHWARWALQNHAAGSAVHSFWAHLRCWFMIHVHCAFMPNIWEEDQPAPAKQSQTHHMFGPQKLVGQGQLSSVSSHPGLSRPRECKLRMSSGFSFSDNCTLRWEKLN